MVLSYLTVSVERRKLKGHRAWPFTDILQLADWSHCKSGGWWRQWPTEQKGSPGEISNHSSIRFCDVRIPYMCVITLKKKIHWSVRWGYTHSPLSAGLSRNIQNIKINEGHECVCTHVWVYVCVYVYICVGVYIYVCAYAVCMCMSGCIYVRV